MSSGRRSEAAFEPPKPQQFNVSLEEWEKKTALDDVQVRSVNAIKAARERLLLLPSKFGADKRAPRGLSHGLAPNKPGQSPRPVTPGAPPAPAATATATAATHALHPKAPVQLAQQFHDWFALIERSVAHGQEAHFRAHATTVSAHLAACDALVARLREVDAAVAGMLDGWAIVERGGRSLEDACEKLLRERENLLTMTEEVDAHLEYFQQLEPATRLLNRPGESLVLQGDFLDTVERVDICISFLLSHRHYRESDVHLLRYQQCMTRAMTLIKMYFVNSLRALSSDTSKRLSEKEVSATAQMHLLYTKFHSIASQLSPLIAELERRTRSYPEELSALLSECHTTYFNVRKALLIGPLTQEIQILDPARTEIVELTRAGCSYLKQLCTDEYRLYTAFFHSGEDQLHRFLENLCDYLYDDLRPRILHEPRLTVLCDVCNVLQALLVLGSSIISELPADGEEEGPNELTEAGRAAPGGDDLLLTIDLDSPMRKQGRGRWHINNLLEMILQDAQTRLFFKAQSIINSEVRQFSPRSDELAYPDKLMTDTHPNVTVDAKDRKNIDRLLSAASLDRQHTWFPTVQSTVWVLSQLHGFVKPAIFQDIAQESLDLCRQSLAAASEVIKIRNAPSSILDGRLFQIRHLLILKDLAKHLELRQSGFDSPHESTDAAVKNPARAVLHKPASLLPNTLFASLGMLLPEGSILPARAGIDNDLRAACSEVISQCADPLSRPLLEWMSRVREHNKSKAPSLGAPITEQSWAQLSSVGELAEKFRTDYEQQQLPSCVHRLRLYLQDPQTVSALTSHILDSITGSYSAFRQVASSVYPEVVSGEATVSLQSAMALRRALELVIEPASMG